MAEDLKQIFTNPYSQKTQIWSTQGAKIYCAGFQEQTTLACLTGVTVQLTRSVQDKYPLGAGSIIRLVGAPQGRADFTSLLGPQSNLGAFLRLISDLCQPTDIIIKPLAMQDQLDCLVKADLTVTLQDCTATTMGLNIQEAQQGLSLVNVPVSIQFTNLLWDQKTSSSSGKNNYIDMVKQKDYSGYA